MARRHSGKHSSRRLGRTMAFQVLYGLAFDLPPDQWDLLDVDFILVESPAMRDQEDPKAREYAGLVVQGVIENRPELDELISRFSRHWKIARIAKVEISILRLAIFEMLHCPDIPLKVAINEGVELAKAYGDEHSPNFINGILDAAAKAVDRGEFEAKKAF